MEKLKLATQSTYPFCSRSERVGIDGYLSKECVGVTIHSRKFCEGAISVGITPRKTWSAFVPDFAIDSVDFWRGMIDGDGSVGIAANGTRPLVTHSGHKLSKVPQQFKEWAEKQGVKVNQSSAGVKKQAWSTSVMGADAVRIARILYADAPDHLRLDRKYEAWQKIESLVHEKAVNCKSGTAIKNYGPLWTPEELEMAEESLKKELAGSHRSKPPSRKGVRLVDGVWVKP